jgi:hypothetical protein
MHGDVGGILVEFSKARRASRSLLLARVILHTVRLTAAQAFNCFLNVYKDAIRYLPKFKLDPDAPEVQGNVTAPNFANPATDFRILGINVFKKLVVAKYHSQMWGCPSKQCCIYFRLPLALIV